MNTGKPSAGCALCRQRRVKVGGSRYVYEIQDIDLPSAMKPNQNVVNASKGAELVQVMFGSSH